ncbi:MAG: hypothetical protein ACKPKO_07115, partial [Candidatus Fonsibacter sp.]
VYLLATHVDDLKEAHAPGYEGIRSQLQEMFPWETGTNCRTSTLDATTSKKETACGSASDPMRSGDWKTCGCRAEDCKEHQSDMDLI